MDGIFLSKMFWNPPPSAILFRASVAYRSAADRASDTSDGGFAQFCIIRDSFSLRPRGLSLEGYQC